MSISPEEKRRYPLVGNDRELLECIHDLEKLQNLSKNEVFLLSFLRSQLESDWQKPCIDLCKAWKRNKQLSPLKRWKAIMSIGNRWWKPRRP